MEIVDPRELAVLLGNLVFASQVMPNARVYLQGMLASFIGLEVEWKRGVVRAQRGAWRPMTLGDAFWRDLDWWDQQLETNNCVPIDPPKRARARPSRPEPTRATSAPASSYTWGASARRRA